MSARVSVVFLNSIDYELTRKTCNLAIIYLSSFQFSRTELLITDE
jgi:hypothetical protein